MSGLIKKAYMSLLSFSRSLAHVSKVSDYTKCTNLMKMCKSKLLFI